MTDETPVDDQQKSEIKRLALMDKVQLIIAVSAVLISAASFYATYLQAQSEERQVKAATWPFLQLENGNYDSERDKISIRLKLVNGGVGPAMVRSFVIEYQGEEYHDKEVFALLLDCCSDPESTATIEEKRDAMGPVLYGGGEGVIIPSGESQLILSIDQMPINTEFWDKLNFERFNFTYDVCYCSLLDKCYRSDLALDPLEVESCPVRTPKP